MSADRKTESEWPIHGDPPDAIFDAPDAPRASERAFRDDEAEECAKIADAYASIASHMRDTASWRCATSIADAILGRIKAREDQS